MLCPVNEICIRDRVVQDNPDLNGDLHPLVGTVDPGKFHVDVGSKR